MKLFGSLLGGSSPAATASALSESADKVARKSAATSDRQARRADKQQAKTRAQRARGVAKAARAGEAWEHADRSRFHRQPPLQR
ncbi:hypothetical protein [Streptomyces anulatus]|uniref:hypothetical protein n=1 Tax=Streptomyces anulatus TaxID=1892 RepID=UPI0036D0AB8F